MCNEDVKKEKRYSKIEKVWNYLDTETIIVNINMNTTPSMCRTFLGGESKGGGRGGGRN